MTASCDHDPFDACDACAACIETGPECDGEVELRWPGYGHKRFWRCGKHGEDRLAREELAAQRFPLLQPADFDALDAGESWDEP